MNAHPYSRVLSVAVVFLIGIAGVHAEENPAKPAAALEMMQYTAPEGWKTSPSQNALARVYLAPDSTATQQTMILMLVTPPQDKLDLATAFDATLKQMTGNGKVVEESELTSSKTRQGFDALSRTLVSQPAGQQPIYIRIVAASVNNRMASVVYLASSKALYDQHQKEMSALLQSVSFADAASVNPLGATANGDPAKAAGEIAALEKKKQELLAQVAEIEARQRQLGATGAAAASDVSLQEVMLAKAREQYAKGLAARRKALVISGDILALNGKPIPNVIAYSLHVWGTTVAAEKTSFDLEVDQNGHYEQQVPDGLYQVKATCTVDQAGHRVPVDLVWLDDKKQGVVQPSSAGIVRDFRLMLNGLKPGEDAKSDRSYFGGLLRVEGPAYELQRGSFGTRYPGARVQLTLTPRCELVDGSKFAAFTIDMDGNELNYSSLRRSIPVGVYGASAVLVAKDGSKKPMPISNNFNGPFGDSTEFFWEASRDNAEFRTEPAIYLKD